VNEKQRLEVFGLFRAWEVRYRTDMEQAGIEKKNADRQVNAWYEKFVKLGILPKDKQYEVPK
jgi:hypothetical protein